MNKNKFKLLGCFFLVNLLASAHANNSCDIGGINSIFSSGNCVETINEHHTVEQCDIPELLLDGNVNHTQLVLTPDECNGLRGESLSWDRCLANNSGVSDFYLTPGDYTSWGRLNLINNNGHIIDSQNGTSRRKSIQYFGPRSEMNASMREKINESLTVKTDAINIVNSQGWVISGLTIKNISAENATSLYSSSDIVINSNYYDNLDVTYGIRVRASSNNCIQNSVLNHVATKKSDSIGIVIQPLHNIRTENNKVINNEIINFGDGVQINHNKSSIPELNVPNTPVNNTLVDSNYIYITEDYRSLLQDGEAGCIENAVDIKAGSDLSNEPLVFKNNRISGYRNYASCGGMGEAFVVQCVANNVVIENNIIFDVELGVRSEVINLVEGHPCNSGTTLNERQLLVRNNLVTNLVGGSTAFQIFTENEVIESNYIANTNKFFENGAYVGSASFLSNTILNVANLGGGSSQFEFPSTDFHQENNVITNDPELLGDYFVWVRTYGVYMYYIFPSMILI